MSMHDINTSALPLVDCPPKTVNSNIKKNRYIVQYNWDFNISKLLVSLSPLNRKIKRTKKYKIFY